MYRAFFALFYFRIRFSAFYFGFFIFLSVFAYYDVSLKMKK